MYVVNASPEVDAQSNYPLILGVSIPLLILMLTVVGLRIYVRVSILRRPGPDDWCIAVAACCSIIYEALTLTQSRYGLGLPLALRPAVNLNKYSAVNYAGRPFYMLGILLFKVALCLSYLRILSVAQRTYRLVVWGVMITCIMGHIAFILVLLLNCNPVKKAWLPRTPGKCLQNAPVNYSLSAIVMAFDVTIFLLPIPFMLKLQMPNRKKYGVIGVFILGLFTTICSGLRMTQTKVVAFGNGNSTLLVLWGNVEMNVGIILTSLPVLTPLFKWFNARGSSKGYHPQGSNSHNMAVFTKSTGGETANTKYTPGGHHTGNESQETILQNEDGTTAQQPKQGEIMKTVQVNISRTDGNRDSLVNGKDKKTFFDSD